MGGYRMHQLGLVAVMVLAVLHLAAACGPGSSANAGDGDSETPPPSRDRTTESDASGGEAADCLSLEDEIGRLGAELEAHEKETFAGLKIVYEPEACAVACFTRDGEETIRRYVSGPEWENAVRVETVEASLRELGAAQAEATKIADELDIPAASDVDITRNRAELYPPDRMSFEQALREAGAELPEHVVVIGPEKPPRPPEGSDPDSGVFLPRQRFGSGGGMMALIRGKLVPDEEGCLRIEDPSSGYDPVPVWPADFGVDASGDRVRVLDKNGRTVGEVGERIEIGGGEIPRGALEGNDLMQKRELGELLERCPGNYWLVTPE